MEIIKIAGFIYGCVMASKGNKILGYVRLCTFSRWEMKKDLHVFVPCDGDETIFTQKFYIDPLTKPSVIKKLRTIRSYPDKKAYKKINCPEYPEIIRSWLLKC